jgi:hypothetical protein
VHEIRSAHVVLFYLFDVAETIDLQRIPGLIGGPTVAARLAPRQATPAYVQYDNPPVSFDGDAVGMGDVEGFHPRFRVYDYGIISGADAAVLRRVERARRARPDADRERRLRAFRLVADRLGLSMWKADVEGKIKTLNDISRFVVEQSSMARGQFLELTSC